MPLFFSAFSEGVHVERVHTLVTLIHKELFVWMFVCFCISLLVSVAETKTFWLEFKVYSGDWVECAGCLLELKYYKTLVDFSAHTNCNLQLLRT